MEKHKRWDSLVASPPLQTQREGSRSQIPPGVYKGFLKFTSSAAGGEATGGNLLGRHSRVTSSLCSGQLPPLFLCQP